MVRTSLLVSHRQQPQVRPLPPGSDPPPSSRAGRWVVLAAAAGLSAGLLLGSSPRSPDPRAEGSPPTADQSAGLGASVNGFPEVLLAVGTDGTRPMELTVWPPSGAVDRVALPASWTAITLSTGPFTDFAAFDMSGHQVALGAPVARDDSITLLAGRPESIVPVATGVSSYAWHSTVARALAYIIEDDGRRWLEVMSGSPRTVARVAEVEADVDLVGWVDAGFVLQSAGRVTVQDETRVTHLSGRYLDAAAGRLLVERDGAVGYIDPITARFDEIGVIDGIAAGRVAPSGQLLAIARSGGVEIRTANGGLLRVIDRINVEHLAWSSDSRFLILADRVEVFVIDTATGVLTALGLGPVVAVGTRSLAVGAP